MENDNFKLNVKRTWKYIKEAKLNLIGYGIVSIIEAITIYLVITRPDHRGLHDLLCNTKVIDTKEKDIALK